MKVEKNSHCYEVQNDSSYWLVLHDFKPKYRNSLELHFVPTAHTLARTTVRVCDPVLSIPLDWEGEDLEAAALRTLNMLHAATVPKKLVFYQFLNSEVVFPM